MKIEFKEHTITLNESHRFFVTGPMFDEPATSGARAFDSFRQAQEEISTRIERHAKQARTERKLALTVFDAAGRQTTIRGVHASRGHLLGVDECGPTGIGLGSRDGNAYPFVPWIGALLKRRMELMAELVTLQQKLTLFAIRRNRDSRVRAEGYDRVIAALETEYAEKTESAQKIALKS